MKLNKVIQMLGGENDSSAGGVDAFRCEVGYINVYQQQMRGIGHATSLQEAKEEAYRNCGGHIAICRNSGEMICNRI